MSDFKHHQWDAQKSSLNVILSCPECRNHWRNMKLSKQPQIPYLERLVYYWVTVKASIQIAITVQNDGRWNFWWRTVLISSSFYFSTVLNLAFRSPLYIYLEKDEKTWESSQAWSWFSQYRKVEKVVVFAGRTCSPQEMTIEICQSYQSNALLAVEMRIKTLFLIADFGCCHT